MLLTAITAIATAFDYLQLGPAALYASASAQRSLRPLPLVADQLHVLHLTGRYSEYATNIHIFSPNWKIDWPWLKLTEIQRDIDSEAHANAKCIQICYDMIAFNDLMSGSEKILSIDPSIFRHRTSWAPSLKSPALQGSASPESWPLSRKSGVPVILDLTEHFLSTVHDIWLHITTDSWHNLLIVVNIMCHQYINACTGIKLCNCRLIKLFGISTQFF